MGLIGFIYFTLVYFSLLYFVSFEQKRLRASYSKGKCHVIANEQAERRREACDAASLMPREVLQQAEKFSIVV